MPASPDDLFQTNRRQPPQRAQKHRTSHGRRQTKVPLQRRPPRAHGRNRHRYAGGCRQIIEPSKPLLSADYDAQSAVERELVLRLSSLLWRLRRTTTVETGLFEIQAEHLNEFRRHHPVVPLSRDGLYAMYQSPYINDGAEDLSSVRPKSAVSAKNSSAELARCFLRLSNLPSYVLDRLSRYEIALWRQVERILATLDDLDHRKPQERRRLLFGRRLEKPLL